MRILKPVVFFVILLVVTVNTYAQLRLPMLVSDGVKYAVAVRYAWPDNPVEANLYNEEGLPEGPFRTDEW